jgi:hypothetical protein
MSQRTWQIKKEVKKNNKEPSTPISDGPQVAVHAEEKGEESFKRLSTYTSACKCEHEREKECLCFFF